MAKTELTGITDEEVHRLRSEYVNKESGNTEQEFENRRCLSKIRYQPEDYDGPKRYCPKFTLKADDGSGERSTMCDTHGGWLTTEPMHEAAEETQAEEGNTKGITHGMYAEDSGLKKEFSEADEKLYDLIMGWADTHGWEEGSPEYMLLEDFALTKVRSMRAEKYLNENGEIVERKEFIEALGQFETHEETHPLRGELRLQKKTAMDIQKELGLTPKAKSQMDTSESEASAMEQIADVAAEAIGGDGEYDPEQFDES
jgi:hypothetical protein